MTRNAVSRREMLVAGAFAFAGAAGFRGETSAQTSTASTVTNEEIVRKYYKAWGKKGLEHVRDTAGRQLHIYERE